MIFNRRNKLGQVGLTLNWFVAFIVIFFIVVIYFVTVIFMAAAKDIPRSELSSGVTSSDLDELENQRKMEYVLNYPVELETSELIFVSDLIGLWKGHPEEYEDLLEEKIKNALDDLSYEYYNWETENWRVAGFSFFILDKEYSGKGGILYSLDVQGEKFISGYCIKEGGFCKNFGPIPVGVSSVNSTYVYLRESEAAWEVYS